MTAIDYHQFCEDLELVREHNRWAEVVQLMSDDLLTIANRTAKEGIPLPHDTDITKGPMPRTSAFGEVIVEGLESSLEYVAGQIRKETEGEPSLQEIQDEHRATDHRERTRDLKS